jgi:hypothetical protein
MFLRRFRLRDRRTDSPLRHLILLVEAEDSSGSPLEFLEGDILPDWCGSGDPDSRLRKAAASALRYGFSIGVPILSWPIRRAGMLRIS